MNPLRRLSDRWRRERRTGLNHHIPMPPDGGEWQAAVIAAAKFDRLLGMAAADA